MPNLYGKNKGVSKFTPKKIRGLKIMSFSEENNPGGYSPLKMTALLAALVEAFVPEYAKIKGIGTRI